MLVLSRTKDEAILIGDAIRITIIDVRGDKVRIGIDAPKDVSVHREEVYDAIRRESEGGSVASVESSNVEQPSVFVRPETPAAKVIREIKTNRPSKPSKIERMERPKAP